VGKEATIKAYYTLYKKILKYKDIIILNNEQGDPVLYIDSDTLQDCHISLSHTKDNAIAFVHLENEENKY